MQTADRDEQSREWGIVAAGIFAIIAGPVWVNRSGSRSCPAPGGYIRSTL